MSTRPFREVREVPPELRIPWWFAALVLGAVTLGVAMGLLTGDGPPPWRAARCVALAAAYSYLAISLVDFAEHFRLEHEVTGRWMTFQAIPLGESLNHLATVGTIVAVLALARRPPAEPELRDWFVVLAPAVFLALGWRDEVVYHRRRAKHREDILHTTAHLAVGVMFSGFITMTLLPVQP